MSKGKQNRLPKINISRTDMKHFKVKEMIIDPFWNDLYEAKENTKKVIYN